jgi:predicted dehydrogenase
MVRRNPRRNALAPSARRQAAHRGDPRRTPRRDESLARYFDADPRLSRRPRKEGREGRLHLCNAGNDPLSDGCAALVAGKHVFLEKPIAIDLWEADELITLARRADLKFTIGYSQRFNPKSAYAKKKLADGTLGEPVTALVSRHLSRNLGKKISGRVKLSPASMEATHDLDFLLWLLEPARPVRVYAQGVNRVMYPATGAFDCMWTTVTLDNGVVIVVGAGWILPPGYPNFSSTWVEIIGSEGALILDDSRRDVWLNTMAGGTVFPLSTMPGEQVDHIYAGAMGPETIHFLEAVAYDRPVMVTPESARVVMEVYTAADLSAERNAPVELPLSNEAISAIAAGAQQ